MEEAFERRRSKVVLVVDDQATTVSLLKGLIEGWGYTFLSAFSGDECLKLVNRVVPRLILLDVEMPAMNGFETCAKLRTNMALRGTPIVFLTARQTAEDVQQCISVGGNDFVIKPFDVEKLATRVDFWTSRRLNA